MPNQWADALWTVGGLWMVKRFGEWEMSHLYSCCILGGGDAVAALNFNGADAIILMPADEITQTEKVE